MGLYGSLYDYIIHGCATNYVLASNLLWQCCMCTILHEKSMNHISIKKDLDVM